jgi:enterochelin esterase-like enzyme
LTAVSRRWMLAGGIGVAALAAVGGAGYGLVQAGVLPGRYQLDSVLGACGDDPGVPDVASGPVTTERFYSRYRKRTVRMIVMRPPRITGPVPVVLALHGTGGDAASAVSLGYPAYLAAAVAAGVPPFCVVAADGGASTYWHPRADGDNPQGMLINEVLPRLERQGYPVGRIGVTGQSMGGYGALLLAVRLGAARVTAVAVASPAVFGSYPDAIAANPGSFDSPADFAANDIQSPAALAVLRRLPVRIDCGDDDPFAAQDAALRRELGDPAGGISSGCHDQAFWRRQLPAELGYLGQHVTAST